MKRIKIYDNFLSEELFRKCDEYSIHLDFSSENRTVRSNKSWPNHILKDSNPIFIASLKKNDELYQEIYEYIKLKLGHNLIAIMFYHWTAESHIPWHNDGMYKAGLTIYLNDKWDIDNGGLFMYRNPDGNISAIEPIRNRLVEQVGGIFHAVCPTSKDSKTRRTIQMFVEN
jgi:2OG-Fe(II) oxygenase superfamily